MNFYRLTDDIEFPNRWYLGDICGEDNWSFISEQHESAKRRELNIHRDGDEMDFTLSEAYGVPIVSEKFRQKLASSLEIEFVPVQIKKRNDKAFYAMVIFPVISCVDEEKSEYLKFEIDDPVRPDKAGEYRGFIKLVVDPKKLIGRDILRVNKFVTAILVSEELKDDLQSAGVTGVKFQKVTE